jgi:uncharacterized membrane protein
VAEAVGGSYNWQYGRTATLTGIPVVLNWPGHQAQWRGVTYGITVGGREGEIDALYNDPTWNTARGIIERYGIDYIAFGSPERNKYGAQAETKFRDRLTPVCEVGSSQYYMVDERALSE